MISRIAVPAFCSICSILLSACGGEQQEAGGRDATRRMAVKVDTALAVAQRVETAVRSVGSVTALEEAEICAEVAGKVAEILFQEGEAVSRGDLLLVIDEESASLLVTQARARQRTQKEASRRTAAEVKRAVAVLDAAEETLRRKKSLLDQGAETRAVYIDAKSVRDSAVAGLAAAEAAADEAVSAGTEAEAALLVAEKTLRDHRVTAPFDGLLGERLVSPGDYFDVGSPIVTLYSVDPVHIEFTVPERHRVSITKGQETTAIFEAVPGEVFEGKVVFVSPQIDPATRSVKVKALFANDTGVLKPGFFCRIRLILHVDEESPVVPEAAIVPKGALFYVYVVSGEGIAVLTGVQLGERMAGKVQIKEGLSHGDEVIVAGHQKVSDGIPVQSRNAAGENGTREGG